MAALMISVEIGDALAVGTLPKSCRRHRKLIGTLLPPIAETPANKNSMV